MTPDVGHALGFAAGVTATMAALIVLAALAHLPHDPLGRLVNWCLRPACWLLGHKAERFAFCRRCGQRHADCRHVVPTPAEVERPSRHEAERREIDAWRSGRGLPPAAWG